MYDVKAQLSNLNKLQKLGLNIPNIVGSVYSDDSANRDQRMMNLKAMLFASKSSNRLLLPWSTKVYSPTEVLMEINKYPDRDIIVYAAPRTAALIKGTCKPTRYYNEVKIGESEAKQIYWGMDVSSMFPETLKKAVYDLNGFLSGRIMEVSGMEIVFSYHIKGEGVYWDRVLFWGIPIKES